MPHTFDLLADTPTTPRGFPTGAIVDRFEADRIAAELDADPNTGPAEFAVAGADIVGSGAGKTVLLYNAMREVAGGDIIRRQGIGDCVSMGSALAVDLLVCLQVVAGDAIEWKGETATEIIYAGSRQEVGGGRLSGDGSQGAWAARWLTEWGALPRGVYGGIDLSRYDASRARSWGAPGRGVPDELEPAAREHPVKTASRVRSYEDARDAIANGYPVTFASGQGFTTTRDGMGFCRASGTWQHLMGSGGVDDTERPGILFWQSWGASNPSGPRRHDQPSCTFWVDAATVTRICQRGDCWAFSGYVGFPRQDLPWDLLAQ